MFTRIVYIKCLREMYHKKQKTLIASVKSSLHNVIRAFLGFDTYLIYSQAAMAAYAPSEHAVAT